jgi:hypothetical protein
VSLVFVNLLDARKIFGIKFSQDFPNNNFTTFSTIKSKTIKHLIAFPTQKQKKLLGKNRLKKKCLIELQNYQKSLKKIQFFSVIFSTRKVLESSHNLLEKISENYLVKIMNIKKSFKIFLDVIWRKVGEICKICMQRYLISFY